MNVLLSFKQSSHEIPLTKASPIGSVFLIINIRVFIKIKNPSFLHWREVPSPLPLQAYIENTLLAHLYR